MDNIVNYEDMLKSNIGSRDQLIQLGQKSFQLLIDNKLKSIKKYEDPL